MASGNWSKGSAKVSDLDVASRDRLVDAKALLASLRPAGSIAAGLYSLEIRLKVLVCKNLDLPELPLAVQFHDLGELLVLTGLSRRINNDPSLSSIKRNWGAILLIAGQLNDLRYMPDSGWTATEAADFLRRLEHPVEGVLTWLLTV
jgi:hypothetical protein